MILISNNPLTEKWPELNSDIVRIPVSEDALAVLAEARLWVHKHWRFLSDPAAGRDKHRRNPYLSVFLSGPEEALDLWSLQLLERLLLQEYSVGVDAMPKAWQSDFQRLDAELAGLVMTLLHEGSSHFE